MIITSTLIDCDHVPGAILSTVRVSLTPSGRQPSKGGAGVILAQGSESPRPKEDQCVDPQARAYGKCPGPDRPEPGSGLLQTVPLCQSVGDMWIICTVLLLRTKPFPNPKPKPSDLFVRCQCRVLSNWHSLSRKQL